MQVNRKYGSIQQAFRAFDQDCNNYISEFDWQRSFRQFNVDATDADIR